MKKLHGRGRMFVMATVAACALGVPTPASAQEQVLGLLTLPSVFGDEPCDHASTDEIRLYAAPATGPAIGSIKVDSPWTFHSGGGCSGLTVNVHRSGRSQVDPLPTREFAYENPAAIVVDRQNSWYKIQLVDGAAWVQATRRSEFLPLDRLFGDRLTYLTEEWDGRLAATAGGSLRGDVRTDLSERAVRVTEVRRTPAGIWIHVDVLEASPCDSSAEPRVTSQGWVPAHAVSGELTVWFYSRGC